MNAAWPASQRYATHMMRTSVLLLALAGCSGAATDVTADASLDAPATDVDPRGDAQATDAPLADVASPVDASDVAPPSDASVVAPVDGALAEAAPHPPAGSHRCGLGEVTQSDARAACMAPNSFIDSPPPGATPIVRRCDVATLQGGRWEAWCGGGMVYVWSVLRDLRATGATTACATSSDLFLTRGFVEFGNLRGSSSGGATLTPTGAPSSTFSATTTTSAVMEATFNASAAGLGSFVVVATDEGLCMGRPPMPGQDPPMVVSGTSFRWDPAVTL